MHETLAPKKIRVRRETRVRADQERESPVSQQLIHRPIGELGDLVDERSRHVVAQVGVAHATVRVAVIRVLVGVAAGADPIVDRFRILQTVRIGVDGKQREVLRETMLRRYSERIVVRDAAIVHLSDRREISARTEFHVSFSHRHLP